MLNKKLALTIGLLIMQVGCNQPTQQEAKQQAAERFNNQKARIKYVLAQEQYESGQIKKAKASAEEAVALCSDNHDYYLLLCQIYIEEGQLSKASETLRALEELGTPSAQHEFVAGILAERYGRIELALDHHHRAYELEQNNLEYVMAYGETLVSLDRLEEAAWLVDSHITDFDGNGRLFALRGEVLQLLHYYSEAADSFRQALYQYPEDDSIGESYAMALYWAGRYTDALPALRALQSQTKEQMPAHAFFALAHSHMEVGEFATAATYFQDLLNTSKEDNAHIWIMLAQCYVGLDRLDKACAAARQAIQAEPDRPGAQTTLGYVYLLQENWLSARQALSAAIRIDPEDGTALCLLGQVCEAIGQPTQALGYYERAQQVDPGDALASHLHDKLRNVAPGLNNEVKNQ